MSAPLTRPPRTSPASRRSGPGRATKTIRPITPLLRDLQFEPISALKRVFILHDAEGLGRGGADAGNSLLKTLEEPPAYAHFLLTAASTGGVMPTIVSRCQVVHFGLLPAGEIEDALHTRFGVAPAQARFLSAYSEGRLGRAVALARSPALLSGREALLDLAHDLLTAPPIKSFKLGEEFRKLLRSSRRRSRMRRRIRGRKKRAGNR